jgi:hypothetical protein
MDAKPRDPQGNTECRGFAVFHVADGRLDGTDLSGVTFAFYNHFPSNLTAGDWKVGLVVDSAATDEQADALERILSGREGGAFEQLSQFFGEYLGMQRAEVSVTDGEKPWATIEGKSRAEFEALRGADGSVTTVKNAMFGFAPEFTVGHATGHSDAFGLVFDASYGEQADFVFSSEAGEAAVHGRV